MILICYDGSEDAEAAIDQVGELLGSVSQAVLQHADRPVMIVPSPGVAAKRAGHRH